MSIQKQKSNETFDVPNMPVMLGSVGDLLLRREYPRRPIVGMGAVIVDRGRLVLVRKGAEPALGKWSFPGSSGVGGDC